MGFGVCSDLFFGFAFTGLVLGCSSGVLVVFWCFLVSWVLCCSLCVCTLLVMRVVFGVDLPLCGFGCGLDVGLWVPVGLCFGFLFSVDFVFGDFRVGFGVGCCCCLGLGGLLLLGLQGSFWCCPGRF